MRCNKEETRKPTLKNVRKRMLGGLSDYAQTGRACSTRLLLDRLTPSELFIISIITCNENGIYSRDLEPHQK